jgi:hypothetical protein
VKFSIRNDESGCKASVGFNKRRNLHLNVQLKKCDHYNVYLHELGHVLGLMHEHVHPDRKVIILRTGLRFDSDNYVEDESSAVSPYDPTSIMHYNEDSICWPKDTSIKYCDINQSESDGCVVPSEKDCDSTRQKSFGKSKNLSAGDIQSIQTLYGIQTTAGEGTDLSAVTQAPPEATEAPVDTTQAPPVETRSKPKCVAKKSVRRFR